MSKKPAMQGKTRTREHILEELSINLVERYIFLEGFSTQRISRDYGLDLSMATHNQHGEVEPGRVILQVKATDRLRALKDGKTVCMAIERQHLKQWLREDQNQGATG